MLATARGRLEGFPLLAAVAAVALGARVLTAVATDVSYDEAYYWVWSFRFDGAYLDNTPLVAWTLAGVRRVLGDGVLAVRGLAIALGVATIACAKLLADELWADAPAGSWAMLLVAAIPGAAVAGTILSPDSLLHPLWLAALVTLWRAFARPESVGRWALAGLVAGLALLSKYTAGLLLPGALAFALVDPQARRALARPGPYLGALVALAVFAPALVWNIGHDWAGLVFQTGRYSGNRGTLTERLLDYVGGQWLFAGPILFPLALGGFAWARVDRRHRFLACTAAPVLLFFLVSAFRTHSHPNWPAFVWPALAVGVAGAASARLGGFRRAAVLAGTAVCVVLALYAARPLYADVFARRLHGLAELAAAVRSLDDGGMIHSDSYRIGSSIAFALGAADRVWVTHRETHRLTAWDFWGAPPPPGPRPELFFSQNPSPPPPTLTTGRYRASEQLDDIVIRWHDMELGKVRVWRLHP
ncbi:MAG: glycosyltransferase family 39 protein [Candidatus Rokuibacteriota bacterium]